MSRPSDMWYNAIRPNVVRRHIYRGLRARGVPPDLARRVRGWSNGHIALFLRSNGYDTTITEEEVETMPVFHWAVYFGALKKEGLAPTREQASADAEAAAAEFKREFPYAQFVPVIEVWEETPYPTDPDTPTMRGVAL